MLTTHGVAEGEWDGNEWIQYRWSAKVKDSDVYYWLCLEDLTQLEKEGDSLQQEQPIGEEYTIEVGKHTRTLRVGSQSDIDSLIRQEKQEQQEVNFKIEERKWIHDAVDNVFPEDGDFMSEVDFRKILKATARYFYELGKNSK